MWHWKSSCQMTPMGLGNLCREMAARKLSRILFVGDSTSLSQLTSLYLLVGGNHLPMTPGRNTMCERWLNCSRWDLEPIQLRYIRSDKAGESVARLMPTASHCDDDSGRVDQCQPWLHEYASDPAPTLLLLNFGVHYHDADEWRRAFDALLRTLEGLLATNRSGDSFWWRTSAPGHVACQRFSEPLSSAAEMGAPDTWPYDWNLTTRFNHHARHAMRALPARIAARSSVLDIEAMTMLRPDGHYGSTTLPAAPPYVKHDCLHYFLPGPPDWWNHVFMSQLAAQDAAPTNRNRHRR